MSLAESSRLVCSTCNEQTTSCHFATIPCDHHVCSKCLEEKISSNDCGTCLNNPQMYCVQNDCKFMASKDDVAVLLDHSRMCSFQKVQCPQGCGWRIRRRDLVDHLKAECPENRHPCIYCAELFSVNNIEDHMSVCSERDEHLESWIDCGNEIVGDCCEENYVQRDPEQQNESLASSLSADEKPSTTCSIDSKRAVDDCKERMGLLQVQLEGIKEEVKGRLVSMKADLEKRNKDFITKDQLCSIMEVEFATKKVVDEDKFAEKSQVEDYKSVLTDMCAKVVGFDQELDKMATVLKTLEDDVHRLDSSSHKSHLLHNDIDPYVKRLPYDLEYVTEIKCVVPYALLKEGSVNMFYDKPACLLLNRSSPIVRLIGYFADEDKKSFVIGLEILKYEKNREDGVVNVTVTDKGGDSNDWYGKISGTALEDPLFWCYHPASPAVCFHVVIKEFSEDEIQQRFFMPEGGIEVFLQVKQP